MFIPTTEKEKQEMLRTIGVRDFRDLFRNLPQNILYPKLKLPPRLTELELTREVEKQAARHPALLSFLGGGAYDHFIPAAVWVLAMRGEFVTAYTPYQAEASQGTLQAIYEFQSLICDLFSMDVCNASMYDGASSLAEAVLMALRHTGRNRVLYPRSLHPHSLQTVKTYLSELKEVELVEIPCPQGVLDLEALKKHLDNRVAAVVVQHPNFFGALEPMNELGDLVHGVGALLVASVNPASLGILSPPGEWGTVGAVPFPTVPGESTKVPMGPQGADIAVAEGQPLGLPLEYGGPYLGIMTCKESLLRKIPGRLCGMTVDRDGRRGFVLTLQAREQHIRREKATSNICTNEALCALAATIYMALLGPQGMRELGELNVQVAHDLAERLSKKKGYGLWFKSPFFNEFVLKTPIPAAQVQEKLLKKGILPGLPLGTFYPEMKNALLVCATETKTEEDLDNLIRALP
ncbi:MAG: aminomethyl-transferring glycine dehydrogenase subunit GcvPA [Elusimicrobia bacterium]|nr:aminomethyl-transferring glycine dehydrogenase subunit GcvPA [Elusimicrobiota bacterium]